MTFNDLSHLPAADPDKGWLPDPEPLLAQLLIDKMMATEQEKGEKPTAAGTRLRHSDAEKCARYLGLKLAGVPYSDPMDAPGFWSTGLGTLLHDRWQDALLQEYPDASIEVRSKIDDLDASGSADATVVLDSYDDPPRKILVEVKTVGGFAFKMMVGAGKGPATGPKSAYVTQAGINALGIPGGVDEVRIIVLSREAISVGEADRRGIDTLGRILAEWTVPEEVWRPAAEREVKRWRRILELADDEILPPRTIPGEMPPKAVVVDPMHKAGYGRWELRDPDTDELQTSGETWACGYCSMRQACVATDEPGLIDYDEARARIEKYGLPAVKP